MCGGRSFHPPSLLTADDDVTDPQSHHIKKNQQVRLHVLQRSCRRVMRIKCPDVERAAPQQLVLGAGAAAANGTYELKVGVSGA